MALPTTNLVAQLKAEIDKHRESGATDKDQFASFVFATLMLGRNNAVPLMVCPDNEVRDFADDHANFLVHALYETGWTHPEIKPETLDA